jgi:hypothetical protein
VNCELTVKPDTGISLLPRAAFPDIEILRAFDDLVIIEERFSEPFAEDRAIVVEVTGYGERPLAARQEPLSDAALRKIRDPSCRAVNSDLAELH